MVKVSVEDIFSLQPFMLYLCPTAVFQLDLSTGVFQQLSEPQPSQGIVATCWWCLTPELSWGHCQSPAEQASRCPPEQVTRLGHHQAAETQTEGDQGAEFRLPIRWGRF